MALPCFYALSKRISSPSLSALAGARRATINSSSKFSAPFPGSASASLPPRPPEAPKRAQRTKGSTSRPCPFPRRAFPGVPGPNTPFAPGVPLPSGPSGEPPEEDVPEEDAPEDRAPEDALPDKSGEAPPRGYDDEALAWKNYYASPETAAPVPPPAEPPRALTYFESIRPRMEEAFRKGTPDTPPLPRSAPFGVDAVGGRAPRHRLSFRRSPLCVPAVEAQGELPPEWKSARCSCPPLPIRDDEGFYVAFQDAATGEFVK